MAGDIENVIPGEPVESGWGNRIRDRVVSRYADATEREFLNPFPEEGQLSWIENEDRLDVFDGTDHIEVTLRPDLVEGLFPKVNRAGDTMQGLFVLNQDPVGNLDAATKQYVDAQDAIRRPGYMISSGVSQGVVNPGGTDTVIATINLSGITGPVVVSVQAMLRAAAASEGDAFEVWMAVDGGFNLRSTTGFPTFSGSSHTHNIEGSTTTGSASGHQHGIAVGSHTHGSRTSSVNVGVSSLTASNNHLVNLANPGGTVNVQILGRVRSGSPATWHLNAQAMAWLS